MSGGSIGIHAARRVIRLVGEVREIGRGTPAAREHLVGRLLVELGAAVGGAVRDEQFRVGGKNGCVEATLAGFDASTLTVYRAHDVHGSDINPLLRAIMTAPRERGDDGSVLTATHRERVPTRAWERSPWVNEYARPAHVAHFLGSIRFMGVARGQGLGFMRAMGDRPFGDEEKAFLHLVNHECPALFAGMSGPESVRVLPPEQLAPRVRETLEHLLEGEPDKEIAARLGISPHTVRQYVKTIYRTFGVSSRAQLIARRGR
jgi:DNA-binding CsgD family transcriptional regulator